MIETMIVITNNSNKEYILKKLSKEKKLCNLKFYSFSELKKKLFFDYDDRALEYIMNKYHVNISVADTYIKNMYFLKNLDNEKIRFLNNLKYELIDNDLLILDELFKNYLSNKKIIVYGYKDLTKEQEYILKEINGQIEFIDSQSNNFIPKVYEAKNDSEEVLFVVTKVSELLHSGVDIKKIKIIAGNEYLKVLNRYFKLFNVPINLNSNNSFYGTFIAQEFLKDYDKYSLEENILNLNEKYRDISNLVNIINKSVLVKDKTVRKEFIIRDLKNTKVKAVRYDKAIDICTIEDVFLDDDYVFWLGFNINFYPKVYKDDDYLSDKLKEELSLDTSTLKNRQEKEKIKNRMYSIQNLIITYKLSNSKNVFYPSLLISDLNLEVLSVFFDNRVSYSKLNTELLYAKDLDNLYKFNIISDNLGLYKNNLDIKYREYNNIFTGIKLETLNNRIGDTLTLAYTNMEMYNECSFKYYLSKILKIDIFEESFKTIIGNVVHHILEIGLTKEINIDVEIIKFIKEKDYVLNKREYFYLEKLSKELEFVLNIIKEQEKHTKLNNYLFESDIEVYKDRKNVNVTFKGFIDKVMYADIDGERILAVVDYKTGSTLITLDNLDYGLNMQLPIYLYLLKKSEQFKDSVIAGFYIQRVLDNIPVINTKKSLRDIRSENLKLQGYSNSSTNILELIDDEYNDSKVIKGLRFKNDGSLYSSAKVLSSKEMDDLTDIVDSKIEECIENIINGNYDINPKVIKGKNISCSYCKFKDICFMEHKNEVILGGEDGEMDGRASSSD